MTKAADAATRAGRAGRFGVPARRSITELVNWPGLVFLGALIAFWQLSISTGSYSSDSIPSPVQILSGLSQLYASGELMPNVWHTVVMVVTALIIASFIGVFTGVAIGTSRLLWTWTGATIDVLRSLPVIALVPVALVIFGLSGTSEVVVAVFAATWLILVNTAGGVAQIHPRLADVGRTLGMPKWAVFAKITLPASAPAITVGIRIGATVCLLVTLVSEMVGNPEGIGYGLVRAQYGLQPEQMYAYVLVVLMIAIVLNAVVLTLSRLVVGRR